MRKKLEITERELTRAEYQRLLDAAQARGDVRLLLLLETLCATGIRVSELQYITVEAARNGVAEIALKGKIRTILLPTKLCRKLLKYAKKCGIVQGQIFLTKKGNGLSRKFIWAEMKKLCEAAKVARSKAFPHLTVTERLTRGGRETIMGEVGRAGELHGMMLSGVPVSFTMNAYLFPAKKHMKNVRICVKQGGK